MKKLSLLAAFLICTNIIFAQTFQQLQESKVLLPNGWSLTPVGKQLPLGDLPLNIAVSHNKKLMAVTNNGNGIQNIDLIDVKKGVKSDSVDIPKSWYGLTFSDNDKFLYASGGDDNRILKYAVRNNRLQIADTIKLGKPWPEKISPTGIQVNDKQRKLYVVTKENFSLYVIDLPTKSIQHRLNLGAEAYACLLSTDNKTLYISLWGGEKVLCYDIKRNQITDSIPVGSHPNEMCLTKNGKYLFVANANDNSVSVIDTRDKKVIETLNAALYPNAPSGSTSNGVALSDDNKTLYIANADNNCLTVYDVSKIGNSKSKGFIPVGWYPTNVKVIGDKIYVSNGKGLTSLANPYGPNPFGKKLNVIYHGSAEGKKDQYIGSLFKGTLSIINVPDKKQLGVFSKAVYANTPYSKNKELQAVGEVGNPIPMKVGDPSPIKYVFYIIKENRTFDQVLSDLPGVNGDTTLLFFGKRITPNQHALAEEFVAFDNFYCDAEVSADGHNWSMGAYATDYLEKHWPSNYSGRGGEYDAEGTRKIANNRDGFIWDQCKRYNVTYRTYGEFADDYKPNIPVLKNHLCTYYTSWDQHVRDTVRVHQWMRDFDSLVVANAVPQLSTLRLINDHTEGMSLNRPTPYAHVADNDLAVGMFIEHLSKSKIWNQSAVFILEDDAQNGADHVDAHRSTLYLISPYAKRHFVDHTMYSTSSVIRTMELILGMPPMTQYDAAATPMWRAFTAIPDFSGYQCLPSNVDLNEKNIKVTKAAKISASLDFSKEDRIPDAIFNEVLWQGLKGKSAPAPNRAAFVKISEVEDDD